ncbi:MAG TPA: hypothetical protein VFB27_00730 [Opitutaceae bacterium]|nr:hypothetical protein [Opitutaceae bacterium]
MKASLFGFVLAPLLIAAVSLPAAQPRAPATSKLSAPEVLDPVGELRQIDKTAYNDRQSLVEQVNQRIADSEQLMRAMQSRAKSLDAPSRAQFNTYIEAAKKQEMQLKRSVDDLRNAKPDTWEHAQVMLGTAYQFFDDAMEVLNVIAPPVTPQ